MAIDYATMWVEAQAFNINTTVITAKFLYEHVLIRFEYLLTIVIDYNIHFINDVIKYLIDHLIFKHTNFIMYYL